MECLRLDMKNCRRDVAPDAVRWEENQRRSPAGAGMGRQTLARWRRPRRPTHSSFTRFPVDNETRIGAAPRRDAIQGGFRPPESHG